MSRDRYYVAPTVKPGDSISWSQLHDSPEVTVYEDGEPYWPGSAMCHQRRVEYQGVPFTPIPYCTFGDYDGSTAVERSNLRVMRERFPWLVHVTGDYGSEMLGYLGKLEYQNPDLIEAIEGLESYPVADEDDESQLELEMESEAWADYGRSDFRRALAKHTRISDDRDLDLDDVPDRAIDELWYLGADAYNLNGGPGFMIEGGGGVYFLINDWIKGYEQSPSAGYSDWSRKARANINDQMARLNLAYGWIRPSVDPELDLTVRRALVAIHLGWSGTATPRELVKQCTDRESCSVLADWLDERTPLAAPDRQMDLDLPFVLATGTEVHASA